MKSEPEYFVTKTYGHNLGLSTCFRQWKAQSHCSMLHGYALEFKLVFGCSKLDEHDWVIDFGGLDPIKKWLVNTFDHKLLVAADDPALEKMVELGKIGLADVLVIPEVGCEAFARLAYGKIKAILVENNFSPGATLISVEVREHGANSAGYGW